MNFWFSVLRGERLELKHKGRSVQALICWTGEIEKYSTTTAVLESRTRLKIVGLNLWSDSLQWIVCSDELFVITRTSVFLSDEVIQCLKRFSKLQVNRSSLVSGAIMM